MLLADTCSQRHAKLEGDLRLGVKAITPYENATNEFTGKSEVKRCS